MEIRLGLCTLRPWRLSDEQALAHHANNRKIWRNLRDAFPHPYDELDAVAWIAKHVGVEPVRFFAIDHEGELAGSIAIVQESDVHARSAEIGYFVAEPFWGRGIATQAVRGISAYAFDTIPELARLHAAVFEWNRASMRVLEKAGFECEGVLRQSIWKDGALVNSMLYAKLRP
ncbi:MAG: GNAT family N-acetyltransferase [Planctomycetes bacterium]|nr:GNAT family N-acetyltransferase [Planctomycetota bacterium]